MRTTTSRRLGRILRCGPLVIYRITSKKLSDFPRMGEEHPDTYLNALGFRKLVHGNHIVVLRLDGDRS